MAVKFGEPLTVFIRHVPLHRINRCIPNFLMDRWIRAHERFKLILRDRRFSQIEVAGESDSALLFPGAMTVLELRASHGERPGRHPDHHAASGTLEI